ncbi:hypothetical protein ACG2LH_09100 [Zhouia sp. PK063]|uniref:hypothetical protein n=1 Tax=Zhouia sp. PK063 TaxID=3373602 RepID=UPI0037A2B623
MKPQIVRLDFGSFHIYENYAISYIDEGIDIILSNTIQIVELLAEHFENKPFIYISDRVHSYSIDPTVYTSDFVKALYVVHYFIVVDTMQKELSIEIEKIFSNVPISDFRTIDEAKKAAESYFKS